MEGIIARLKEVEKPTPLNPQELETKAKMKKEEQEIKNIVEAIVKKVLTEQEDERERLRQAQRERAQKYCIEPKEGGNLTKPSEFKDVPVDQFADPVNYRYPVDKEHVRAALTYFNQPDNRQAGGSTHEAAVKIMTKIIKAALTNDISVSYQSDDPVYRDLPEQLKRNIQQTATRGLGASISTVTR